MQVTIQSNLPAELIAEAAGARLADRGYAYHIKVSHGGTAIDACELEEPEASERYADGCRELSIIGRWKGCRISVIHGFSWPAGSCHLDEVITIRNDSSTPVKVVAVSLGFRKSLAEATEGLSLVAVPFRKQIDGKLHDYGVDELLTHQWSNSNWRNDDAVLEQVVCDDSSLRSEAWSLGNERGGLLIAKYNNEQIEHSMCRCDRLDGEPVLQFGGAGLSLYNEPRGVTEFESGESFSFGLTRYIEYQGDHREAYRLYRDFLDARGHALPDDYDPPVNWNELYDVGWFHSNRQELSKHYTRESLLKEAATAKQAGCELLYLDPGWEVAEGTTRWDEPRLGKVSNLVEQLRREHGLQLGYRTIARCYCDEYPREWLIQRSPRSARRGAIRWGGQQLYEVCTQCEAWQEEKLRRMLSITQQGVRFMMFDEMDWRGPCYDPTHGHPIPCTPLGHVRAILGLCRKVREQCPGVLIEMHDPVWPWSVRYLPTYFGQGFEGGAFQENWGFEFMWNPIGDIRRGAAMSLYYYAAGCNIPLYLHITMANDNDACLFFWWAASTVRHIGIGGADPHATIPNSDKTTAKDPDRRFAAYCEAMKLYRRLKPYFVRGTFTGLAETLHLHTLPGRPGGVLNVFNLTDDVQRRDVTIPSEVLAAPAGAGLEVEGASAEWRDGTVELEVTLPAMSPAIVLIGDAVTGGPQSQRKA